MIVAVVVVGWFSLLQFGFPVVVVAKFWWKMVMWVYEREKEREREREIFFFYLVV